MSAEGRALRAHRSLVRVAFAAAHMFAWVFVFQYFAFISRDASVALGRVALLYALVQVTTAIATPRAAMYLRNGVRAPLLYAVSCAAIAFLALAGGITGGIGSSLAVVLFALGLGLYRAVYFVPYATLQTHPRRSLAAEVLIAFVPLAAGITVAASIDGAIVVLVGAALLLAFSAVMLVNVRETHEKYSWRYRETFQHFASPEYRALVRRSLLDGMVGAAFLFVWPLAIFILLGWSYGTLGVVMTLSLLLAIFVRPWVRSFMRRRTLHTSAILRSILVISPWALRLVVASPFGIILTDSYFYVTTPLQHGMDPLMFEQTSDAGSYVDEHTALKEIALAIGRLVTAVALAASTLLISPVAGFFVVFALAAVAGLTVSRRA